MFLYFFFKQKTAYEMRISDWSSDVCSSDLATREAASQVQVVRFAAAKLGVAVAEIDCQSVGLLFQDDVDHAGNRIGAIDGRGAAGKHFDAIHHAQRNAGNVGGADPAIHRQGEVGQAAAMDQHQGVVRAQAAQVDLLRTGGEVRDRKSVV